MLGLADVQRREVYPSLRPSNLGLHCAFSQNAFATDHPLTEDKIPSRSRRKRSENRESRCCPGQSRTGERHGRVAMSHLLKDVRSVEEREKRRQWRMKKIVWSPFGLLAVVKLGCLERRFEELALQGASQTCPRKAIGYIALHAARSSPYCCSRNSMEHLQK